MLGDAGEDALDEVAMGTDEREPAAGRKIAPCQDLEQRGLPDPVFPKNYV